MFIGTVLPSLIRYIYNEISKCKVCMKTQREKEREREREREREVVCVCAVLGNH